MEKNFDRREALVKKRYRKNGKLSGNQEPG